MNGYITSRTISGIHLPPPVLPFASPAQVGVVVVQPGVNPQGVADGITQSHEKWSDGIRGMLAGVGLGMGLGYLGGAVGGGMGTYYLLPRGLGTNWRTGLSVASSLLLTGPLGAYLGGVAGAMIG